MNKTRLRIRFSKTGDLRWIGHLDLARLWERMLRRAGLKLAFSEGFHPKPKINFPSALALGIEGLNEVVELEIIGHVDLPQTQTDIASQMPAGMQLLSISCPDFATGKVRVRSSTYRIRIPSEHVALVESSIGELLSSTGVTIDREGKLIECDPRDGIFQVWLEDDLLHFTLPTLARASIRPSELLNLLGLPSLLESGEILQRVSIDVNDTTQPDAQRDKQVIEQ